MKQLEILQKLGESLTRLTFRERASELGKLLPVSKPRVNPGSATTALILNQLAEFHLTHKTADHAEELAGRSLSILESIPVASRDLSAFAKAADILAHALDARGEFVEVEKSAALCWPFARISEVIPSPICKRIVGMGHSCFSFASRRRR